MYNPVIETFVGCIFAASEDDMAQSVHGVSHQTEAVYPVASRDYATGHRLAVGDGAQAFRFFDIASVTVTIGKERVVLRSAPLNATEPQPVFEPSTSLT